MDLPAAAPVTRFSPWLNDDLLKIENADKLRLTSEHARSVIGGIDIGFDFENRVGEMGYSLARRLWGKGLATEAAGAVIDAAFSVYPELNRIQACGDQRNVGSLRVMEKLGMVREGVSAPGQIPEGGIQQHGVVRFIALRMGGRNQPVTAMQRLVRNQPRCFACRSGTSR